MANIRSALQQIGEQVALLRRDTTASFAEIELRLQQALDSVRRVEESIGGEADTRVVPVPQPEPKPPEPPVGAPAIVEPEVRLQQPRKPFFGSGQSPEKK